MSDPAPNDPLAEPRARADGDHRRRMLVERGRERSDRARLQHVVVVQEPDVLAAHVREPNVAGSAGVRNRRAARIALGSQEAQVVACCQPVARAVAAAVVDHDQLGRRPGLRLHAGDGLLQEREAVEGRDDDGHAGRHRRRC
jgi:hypothetical protein